VVTDALGSAEAMTNREIMRVVNRWIGVSGGYLGDFSYRTHADFYPEFCDLDIDPYAFEGTTRERFIQILGSLRPSDQAKMLRGVIERFPIGQEYAPGSRNEATLRELKDTIARLDGMTIERANGPRVTSEVVRRALADADTLIASSGATSAVDRTHTAMHGYLLALCSDAGITVPVDASMTALFKTLRRDHPKLADLGSRSEEITKVLNASASILDAMNPVRNRASVAHPNSDLLGDDEARLVISVSRSLLNYLDARLGE
jgi:Abortive infection C-terminus